MAAQRHVAGLRQLNRRLVVLALVALLATAVVWQWVPAAVALVAGPSYADSGAVLRVFMLGVTVNIVGSLLSSELQGFGDSRFVAKMGVFLAVVFYLALAVGVWLGGALGAAWGATAAFGAQWVISSWRMRTRGFLR
jgi:O-antigen/teichoic acid export membrane protein